MLVKRLCFISVFLCLACASIALAQPGPADPKRESPRATLKTFLDAFGQPRIGVTPDPLEEAVRCIDLEGIPSDYRNVRGFEVAADLYEVIHAIENFHADDVPAETKGDPFHLYRSQHGEIVLTRQPNGEWLFSQDTVRVIPLLVADLEEQRATHGSGTLTQSDSLGSQIRERMPPVLRPRTLGLERWQWLGLLVLALLGIVAYFIVRGLASIILGRLFRRRLEQLSDAQRRSLYGPFGLFALVFVVRLGLRALALTQGALGFLRSALFVLTSIAVIWLIYRVVDLVILKLRERASISDSTTDDLLVPFVGGIVRFAVVIIGLVIIAENLEFNVTGLIAGLGIGGIAIALASQETLSNFFGSLVLLVERPFKAEDRVEIDGVKGIVKEVGMRSTRILTFDESLVTVPNAHIATESIINDGARRHRRWVAKLHVPYANGPAKIEQLCEGIRKIIADTDALFTDVYRLHIFDVQPPCLVLRVEINFTTDDYEFELAARHQFILDVLRLAEKLGVQLEVPN